MDEEKYLQWQVTEVTLYIMYIIICYIYHILFSNGEKYSQWQGTGGTPRKTSPPGTLLSPRELEYPGKKRGWNVEQILHFDLSNMAVIVTRQLTVTIIHTTVANIAMFVMWNFRLCCNNANSLSFIVEANVVIGSQHMQQMVSCLQNTFMKWSPYYHIPFRWKLDRECLEICIFQPCQPGGQKYKCTNKSLSGFACDQTNNNALTNPCKARF